MSGAKRSTSSNDTSKAATVVAEKVREISDGLSSKKAAKRTTEDLLEPRDWKPFNRQVFITKGAGSLRESVPVKTGETKDVFFILGTCADHKVFVLQVWGVNARVMYELFQ